jgi:hypothetical protein
MIRVIVERPLWTYIHMGTGLLNEINENGEDMLLAVRMLVRTVMYLTGCILLALIHMWMLAMYPITKACNVRRARRDLKPEYERILRRAGEAE